MTGVIWFVQIVHYPLFAQVGNGPSLRRYETLHATRTGWVVFPPMLIELLSSLALLYAPLRPACVSPLLAVSLAALVLILWLLTGLIHVPLHNTLGRPSTLVAEQHTISRLVATNWIRTAAWTLRSALLLYALSLALT